MSADEIMTKDELIGYLKISKGTLQKLMKGRAFPFVKLEKRVLFRKKDVDKWLESKLVKPEK